MATFYRTGETDRDLVGKSRSNQKQDGGRGSEGISCYNVLRSNRRGDRCQLTTCWTMSTLAFTAVVVGFCLSPRVLRAGDAPLVKQLRPQESIAVIVVTVGLLLLSAIAAFVFTSWGAIIESRVRLEPAMPSLEADPSLRRGQGRGDLIHTYTDRDAMIGSVDSDHQL